MILLADSVGPDQTAWMPRLIKAFAVCICSKILFHVVQPKSTSIWKVIITGSVKISLLTIFFFFYAPAIFKGGRGDAYSITAVRTYVSSICLFCPSVRPIHNTNGFRAISYEKMVYWIEILYTSI